MDNYIVEDTQSTSQTPSSEMDDLLWIAIFLSKMLR